MAVARRSLIDLVRRQRPDVEEPERAIVDGRVRVDGAVVSNPRSQVRSDASVVVEPVHELQGVGKLGYALDRFGVSVDGRIALDVGASTGGFTTALLRRGAARVFAVDAGYGQLLGSLRQDPRVVNLERTNVADLTPALLDHTAIELIVIDVSKLSLASAIEQVTSNLAPAAGTELVGLVKPMFELRLAELPTDEDKHAEAVQHAIDGARANRWEDVGSIRSAVTGHRGAVEHFVHARRA